MSSTAILSVKILGDATNAKKAISDVGDQAGQTETDVKKSSTGMGSAFGTLAKAIAAAGIIDALKNIGEAAFNSAKEFQDASHGMETVFGTAADTVATNAQSAAKSMGLSAAAYDQMAAGMGEKLENLGFTQSQAADTTQELAQRAADLAAVYGGSTSDAMDTLSAAMAGSYKGAKNLGIIMNAQTIAAYEAANGMSGLTGDAKKNADAQAALAIIMQQSSNAAGQYADDAGDATEAQESATASWEDAKEKLGTGLLPIVEKITTAFGNLADWVSRNSTTVEIAIGVIGGLAAAILLVNTAMTIYKTISSLVTAAQWLMNAAMSANPIGLIIIAVTAIIAVLALLIAKCEPVRKAFTAVWDGLKSGFEAVKNFFSDTIDKIVGFFTGLRDKVLDVVNTVKNWFTNLGQKIVDAFHISLPGWVTKALNFLGLMANLDGMTTTVAMAMPSISAAPLSPVTASYTTLPRLASAIPALTSLNPAASSSTTIVNVTVEVPPSVNPAEVGREVAKSLAAFRQIGGQF